MKKFFKGFVFAWNGLKYAFLTQLNIKFHFFATVLVVTAGIFFDLQSFEWLWIAVSIALILIAELLNTAIEVLVDLVSPEYHVKAGIIKDVSAGAVLISALFALIVGVTIFVPKVWPYVA